MLCWDLLPHLPKDGPTRFLPSNPPYVMYCQSNASNSDKLTKMTQAPRSTRSLSRFIIGGLLSPTSSSFDKPDDIVLIWKREWFWLIWFDWQRFCFCWCFVESPSHCCCISRVCCCCPGSRWISDWTVYFSTSKRAKVFADQTVLAISLRRFFVFFSLFLSLSASLSVSIYLSVADGLLRFILSLSLSVMRALFPFSSSSSLPPFFS